MRSIATVEELSPRYVLLDASRSSDIFACLAGTAAIKMSDEQISLLIGDIYDAALQPSSWPHALEGVCRYVGGSMGNIFWQDVIAKKAKKFFEWGADPYYTQLYMETYARINPMFPAAHSFPVGRPFTQAEVISFDELRETRLYREWMQPQGYIDFIACHL